MFFPDLSLKRRVRYLNLSQRALCTVINDKISIGCNPNTPNPGQAAVSMVELYIRIFSGGRSGPSDAYVRVRGVK